MRPRSLAERLHELEVLHETLRTLTSTLDLGDLVRLVLGRMKSVAEAEALSLLLYDPERDELVFAASESLRDEVLAGGAPADATPTGAGLEPERLAVPLRRRGRIVGLLELNERRDGRPFDTADQRRIEAVATGIAETMNPAFIARDAEALHEVFARVAAVVPAHTTALRLQDAPGRELVFTSSRVLQPGVVDGVRLSAQHGIAGWVAQNREAVCLEDASADPRHDPTLARRTGLIPRSMISVPLVHRDALLGVVQVINKLDGTAFTGAELRLVQALADHAAIAIANAQLYRRVEVAARTDDLTGLGNTRHFNAILPAALARGGPVSLLVLDLDGLKGIVDRHGHLVGSRAIATVGRLIAERLRPGDVGARFGGDEFVVVLPGTETADALAFAERIRDAVAAFATPDGMTVDVSELTASIGVATYPDHAEDAESLFRAADRALYRVKGSTKNAVAEATG